MPERLIRMSLLLYHEEWVIIRREIKNALIFISVFFKNVLKWSGIDDIYKS
jgi:hypothetical protein